MTKEFVKFNGRMGLLKGMKLRLSVNGGYIDITKSALSLFLEFYGENVDIYISAAGNGRNVIYIYLKERCDE